MQSLVSPQLTPPLYNNTYEIRVGDEIGIGMT